MKRMSRIVSTLALALMSLNAVPAAGAGLASFSTKPATLNGVSIGGIPLWYQDQNGVAVQPCFYDRVNCSSFGLGDPMFDNRLPPSYPGNFPSEAFYFKATAVFPVGPATASVDMALEYTFVDALGNLVPASAPGAVGNPFQRLRFIMTYPTGTAPPLYGNYTIRHPWGTTVFPGSTAKCVNTLDGGTKCSMMRDLPIAGPNPTAALGGAVPDSISTFLRDPAAPPGFLGIGAASSFTGAAPGNDNSISVTDGANTGTTTSLTLLVGKVLDLEVAPLRYNFGPVLVGTVAPALPTPPPAFTVTNINTAKSITIGAIAISGIIDAADFAIVPVPDAVTTCAANLTLPPALPAPAVPSSCTFGVTFTSTATRWGPIPGLRIATVEIPATFTPDDQAIPIATIELIGTVVVPLTLTFTGTGGGSVSGTTSATPATLFFSNNGSASITGGAVVTLTVNPATASTFTAWSGCDLVTDNQCTVTMNSAKNLTVNIDISEYTVTFTAGANGSITGTTSQKVNYGGSTSSVTAVSGSGYHFLNWTGTGAFVTTTANPLTVANVTATKEITANFAPDPVNGACGSTNGQTFTVAPTTNLCAAGTASVVTGAGPWGWSCTGLYGGTQASCSAAIQTYSVTPTAGTGGSINPNNVQTFNYNALTSFTVAASTGFQIATVTGCGGSLVGNTYTTGPITGHCAVSASFSAVTGSSGQIPHDGIINQADGKTGPEIGDALQSFRSVMGLTILSDTEKVHADVAPLGSDGKPHGNGVIDIGDVVITLRRVVGAITW